MNWVEVAVKLIAENNDGVKLAPLGNISGVDIRFDKGYGTLKINVPANVADDLTNGSGKYVGGLLLIDRQAYEEAKKGGGKENNEK